MWYMIIATDVDNMMATRLSVREAHLQRLEELKEQGRLLLAGPNPLPENDAVVSGSLIVAKFADLDAAQEWVENDPYASSGVYADVLIKPFIKVLP